MQHILSLALISNRESGVTGTVSESVWTCLKWSNFKIKPLRCVATDGIAQRRDSWFKNGWCNSIKAVYHMQVDFNTSPTVKTQEILCVSGWFNYSLKSPKIQLKPHYWYVKSHIRHSHNWLLCLCSKCIFWSHTGLWQTGSHKATLVRCRNYILGSVLHSPYCILPSETKPWTLSKDITALRSHYINISRCTCGSTLCGETSSIAAPANISNCVRVDISITFNSTSMPTLI